MKAIINTTLKEKKSIFSDLLRAQIELTLSSKFISLKTIKFLSNNIISKLTCTLQFKLYN